MRARQCCLKVLTAAQTCALPLPPDMVITFTVILYRMNSKMQHFEMFIEDILGYLRRKCVKSGYTFEDKKML